MKAVFITNTRAKLAERLLNGDKTVETRNRDTLRQFVGEEVAVITRRSGMAYIIGALIFDAPITYNTVEEFRDAYDAHKVMAGSKFDITKSPTLTKVGYPVVAYRAFEPISVDTAQLKHYGRQGVELDWAV